jgi:ATP-dependent helicase/nuclease subunit A
MMTEIEPVNLMPTQTHASEDLATQDTQHRIDALADASFIIEAPAGAGKTELLTQRYLKLLASVNAPEEIIALTFTKKAAGEMANRILTSLQAAQSNTPVEKPHQYVTRELALQALAHAQSLDWQLLAQPSRLRILTMDALCSSLTRQMPLLSAFGGTPSVAEDTSTYYLEAARRAIAAVESESDLTAPVSLALQLFDNNSQSLAQLLADMLGKRDQWQSYTVNLTHFDRHYVDDAAKRAIQILVEEKLAAAYVILSPEMQFKLMPIVRFAASHLDAAHAIHALIDWHVPLSPSFENAALWQAIAEFMLTKDGNYRKTLNASQGIPAGKSSAAIKSDFVALVTLLEECAPNSAITLKNIRQLPTVDDIAENQRYIHALTQLLMQANAHLWTIFQAAGEVDFIGISERAQLALGDGEHVTDLALALDYQISHLLIDEFQDTSPVQLSLIEKLTAGWQADDGRTLFCVGDPMQSIYRFRKAEVSIFLEVSEYGIGDITLKKLALSRNNRSQPAVIDWINHTFKAVFPALDHIDHGAIQYRPFVATKTSLANEGVNMHALVLDNPNPDNEHDGAENALDSSADNEENIGEHDLMQVEARHVAKLIDDAKQEITTQTIAVLVRSRKHLSHLVTHMKREFQHIPFQAVEIEALNDRQIIQDVLSLTYALHHLADRVHWLNILRAPWCGLTLNDLYTIAGKNHHATVWQLMLQAQRDKTLSDDGHARLTHVIAVIENALMHQGKMPVRRWLESVWLQLGGAKCLIATGDIRDVNTLFDLIETSSHASYVDFEKLNIGLAKLFAEPNSMADGTVQFLTIHRAKGLEFDVVIVPGLNRKTRADDQPLVLWQEVKAAKEHCLLAAVKQKNAPIYNLLKSLEKKRSDYEAARLLYVAATRAIRQLHLVATIEKMQTGTLNPATNSFLALLWPVVSSEFLQAAPIKLELNAGLVFADFVPKLQRLPLSALTNSPSFNPMALSAEVSDSRDENPQTVATSIESLLSLDINRHMGVLAHRYMELIANATMKSIEDIVQTWTAERLDTYFPMMQAWLIQYGHSETVAKKASQSVLAALKTTLNSEKGRWVLSAHEAAQSELSLTQRLKVNNAGEYLSTLGLTDTKTHVIDRTFIADGVRWIIDYKLAHLSMDDDVQKVAVTHATQLKRYADLFASDGLAIKTAVLFLNTGQLIEITV